MTSQSGKPIRCGRFVLGAVMLAAVLTGCSDAGPWQRVAVRGTVTLDGEPLGDGTITFVPLQGASGPKARTCVRRGSFRFPPSRGPVEGPMRVEIQSPGVDVEEFDRMIRAGRRPAAHKMVIPERFNEHSVLSVEVRRDGSNQYAFDLQSPEPVPDVP